MSKSWKVTIGILIAIAVILLVMTWIKGPKTAVIAPDVSTGTAVTDTVLQ